MNGRKVGSTATALRPECIQVSLPHLCPGFLSVLTIDSSKHHSRCSTASLDHHLKQESSSKNGVPTERDRSSQRLLCSNVVSRRRTHDCSARAELEYHSDHAVSRPVTFCGRIPQDGCNSVVESVRWEARKCLSLIKCQERLLGSPARQSTMETIFDSKKKKSTRTCDKIMSERKSLELHHDKLSSRPELIESHQQSPRQSEQVFCHVFVDKTC